MRSYSPSNALEFWQNEERGALWIEITGLAPGKPDKCLMQIKIMPPLEHISSQIESMW